MRQKSRNWVPGSLNQYSSDVLQGFLSLSSAETRLDQLNTWADEHDQIHLADCFNLNPATNVMNPRGEALMRGGLSTRPSLGYPGDKYEMGLEAVEKIELACGELAAQVFNADFAEYRIASGAIANLYAFMACCEPGDTIIVPPASIGGHVTHHGAGAAGLYRLNIIEAAVSADDYSVDLDGLAEQIKQHQPKLVTIGGSLNLKPHPVAEIVALAHAAGAKVLFDAAHQCGLIAGKAWPNPLDLGVDLMTMSTYKSLGGPAAGLLVTNDASLAEKVDAIAFPGLTANFDAANSAALAVCMMDWLEHGQAYSSMMIDTAKALAKALNDQGMPVHGGGTESHQLAIEAAAYGGGQAASKHLRKAGFLACGIGLPIDPVAGDMNGLRVGTPELVRWGMTPADMPRLGQLIADALKSDQPESMAAEVAAWRQEFNTMHFVV